MDQLDKREGPGARRQSAPRARPTALMTPPKAAAPLQRRRASAGYARPGSPKTGRWAPRVSDIPASEELIGFVFAALDPGTSMVEAGGTLIPSVMSCGRLRTFSTVGNAAFTGQGEGLF